MDTFFVCKLRFNYIYIFTISPKYMILTYENNKICFVYMVPQDKKNESIHIYLY